MRLYGYYIGWGRLGEGKYRLEFGELAPSRGGKTEHARTGESEPRRKMD